jgi:hypothetical protein
MDLKTDSANFNASGARGSPCSDSRGLVHKPNMPVGSYSDSQIHSSRQYWGPTSHPEPTPAPAAPTAYAQAPAQPYTHRPVTQAVPQQVQYPTSGPGYSGYGGQPVAQTSGSPYGVTPTTSPAVSQASSTYGQNYTYNSSTPNSTAGYSHQPSAHHSSEQSRVPRSQTQNADPRAYSQNAPQSQYGQQPAPRYFGNFRPAFLVYD